MYISRSQINDIIEGWIKENPSQWFWVHDRWGIKDVLKKKFKGLKCNILFILFS